ncbi:MAG: hypothetical protein JST59_01895 [Actinobacteria bacterium]|nr:hypothetical protein [Actinomycetota bacterium]
MFELSNKVRSIFFAVGHLNLNITLAMQLSSHSRSESDVKLDISESDSNRKVEDSPAPEKKRFSILEDIEELNRHLEKKND